MYGDINIDLIKYENNNNLLYMSTLMSYEYLPGGTLPARIMDFPPRVLIIYLSVIQNILIDTKK